MCFQTDTQRLGIDKAEKLEKNGLENIGSVSPLCRVKIFVSLTRNSSYLTVKKINSVYMVKPHLVASPANSATKMLCNYRFH